MKMAQCSAYNRSITEGRWMESAGIVVSTMSATLVAMTASNTLPASTSSFPVWLGAGLAVIWLIVSLVQSVSGARWILGVSRRLSWKVILQNLRAEVWEQVRSPLLILASLVCVGILLEAPIRGELSPTETPGYVRLLLGLVSILGAGAGTWLYRGGRELMRSPGKAVKIAIGPSPEDEYFIVISETDEGWVRANAGILGYEANRSPANARPEMVG